MKNIIILSTLLLITMSSCEKKDNFFNGVYKYTEFVHEADLKAEPFFTDTVGNLSLHIIDHYLLIRQYKQPYFIKCYDLTNGKFVGDFFRKGEGPDDFLDFQISFLDYPYLHIQDFFKKKIKVIDFAQVLKNKSPYLIAEIDYSFVNDPYNVFYVGRSDELVIKEFVIGKGLQYCKYNISNRKVSDEFVLYNKLIDYNFINHCLSLADCIKPDGSLIVSNIGILDQLDVIDLQNRQNNFSIVTRKNPPTITEIDGINEKEQKEYYKSYPVCNDLYISALYNGDHTDEIRIFDWQGNGILRCRLNNNVADYCIDWNKGFIYAKDEIGERIYRYNIAAYI